MRNRRRVPELDNDFDTYIKSTAKTLESGSPSGADRLGLSTEEKSGWLGFRDAWVEIYPQHTNPNKRTKTITEIKNKVKRDFWTFSTNPLGKIKSSDNLTAEDRSIFNLPNRDRTRTPRGVIGDSPQGHLHSMGSARIKVRVRMDGVEGRPRKHKWADALEMKYVFVDVNLNFLNPRITVDDCPHAVISKKALFSMDAGQKNLGKRMLAFFRWVNFSNPSHNSGWSEVVNVVVG